MQTIPTEWRARRLEWEQEFTRGWADFRAYKSIASGSDPYTLGRAAARGARANGRDIDWVARKGWASEYRPKPIEPTVTLSDSPSDHGVKWGVKA